MANQIKSLEAFLSDDAEFRTWCAEIIDGITDLGLVQTADTGQIDTGTVARPGTSTYAGYAIFRFADALQATLPVFIKLEFGIASAADRPALRMTTGTSTNGAGTLGGQAGTVQARIASASKTDEAVLNTYFSGHTGQLILIANFDPATKTFHMGFVVGRCLDDDGTPNAEGYYFCSFNSVGASWQVMPPTGSVPTAGGLGAPVVKPDYGANSKSGSEVGIDFPVVFVGEPYAQDSLGCYAHADIGELVAITADHLGETRTWMPMGDGISSALNTQADSTASFVIPWD